MQKADREDTTGNAGLRGNSPHHTDKKMGFFLHLSLQANRIPCICLDPYDLNKAITDEHYKAPTQEEISYWLNGTMNFGKLSAKYTFATSTFRRSAHM